MFLFFLGFRLVIGKSNRYFEHYTSFADGFWVKKPNNFFIKK